MARPSLSVLITNYNHAGYLEAALDAILSQSVRPTEVLVVDDCSTDHSPAILARVAAADPIVRVIRNDHNLGAVAALNRGLAEARGRYLYHNASDDLVLPGAFEQALDLLARYPGVAVCCWDHCWLDDRAGTTRIGRLRWGDQPFCAPPRAVPQLLRESTFGAYNCLVDRRQVVRIGGFLPELSFFSDCFTVTVVALRGGLCYLPGAHSLLRVRDDSYGARARRSGAQRWSMVSALLEAVNSPALVDVRAGFRTANLLRCCGLEGALAPVVKRCMRATVPSYFLWHWYCHWVRMFRPMLYPYLPRPLLALWRLCKRAVRWARRSRVWRVTPLGAPHPTPAT